MRIPRHDEPILADRIIAAGALLPRVELAAAEQIQGPEDGRVGAEDADVDLGQAPADVGDDLPRDVGLDEGAREGGADGAAGGRDDAEAHEGAEGELGPERHLQLAQEEDGEGGADEVGEDGEDFFCISQRGPAFRGFGGMWAGVAGGVDVN